jgi:nitroreductase
MELYEGLLTRRSIRKYNPEKTLTKEEIKKRLGMKHLIIE